MAARKTAAAPATFTQEQVEALIAKALAKALAPAGPALAVSHGLRPCDPVLVREDAELTDEQAQYARSAGVVERLGDGDAVIVDMDRDHKRVSFPATALKLLKA